MAPRLDLGSSALEVGTVSASLLVRWVFARCSARSRSRRITHSSSDAPIAASSAIPSSTIPKTALLRPLLCGGGLRTGTGLAGSTCGTGCADGAGTGGSLRPRSGSVGEGACLLSFLGEGADFFFFCLAATGARFAASLRLGTAGASAGTLLSAARVAMPASGGTPPRMADGREGAGAGADGAAPGGGGAPAPWPPLGLGGLTATRFDLAGSLRGLAAVGAASSSRSGLRRSFFSASFGSAGATRLCGCAGAPGAGASGASAPGAAGAGADRASGADGAAASSLVRSSMSADPPSSSTTTSSSSAAMADLPWRVGGAAARDAAIGGAPAIAIGTTADSGPAACSAWVSWLARSASELGRASGFLSSACSRTCSSCVDSSGRTLRGLGGFSSSTLMRIAAAELPTNGACPVSR